MSRVDINVAQTAVAVALQNNAIMSQASGLVPPEAFSMSPGLALVWAIATDYYTNNENILATNDVLHMEIQQTISDSPGLLSDEEISQISQFLSWAFDRNQFSEDPREVSTVLYRQALQYLRRIGEHYTVEKAAQDLENVKQATSPLEAANIMDQARDQMSRISAMGSFVDADLFPEDWRIDVEPGAERRWTTGLDFLDTALNNGHQPGEVYGILGPYAGGKSTLGLALCCKASKYFYNRRLEGSDTVPRFAYFVSYEMPTPEFQERAMTFMAQINRDRVQRYMDRSLVGGLSDQNSLQPYERAMFQSQLDQGHQVDGEQERMRNAKAIMNQHLRLIDFSGFDPNRRGQGGGGIPEIAAAIRADAANKGGSPGLLVIDYIGTMVRAHLDAINKSGDKDRNRLMISGAALEAVRSIANPMDIPVWFLHQLDAKANDKKAGAANTVGNAAESKAFAENLSYSFALGQKNEMNLFRLDTTKTRRSGTQQYQILHMDGSLGLITSTNGRYVVDENSRSIVPRSDFDVVGGGSAGSQVNRPGQTEEQRQVAADQNGLVSNVGPDQDLSN